MTDKRKLRLIVPCDDTGTCRIKGAHIYDEGEALAFLRNHKFFKAPYAIPIISITIEEHDYCRKVEQKDCDSPYEWECEGNVAWFPCSKNVKGAVPYTAISYISELEP